MGARDLIALMLLAGVAAGCSAGQLQARKDDAWSSVPQALPDGRRIANPSLPSMSRLPDPYWAGYDALPSGYGHPLRPFGYVLYPVGAALDFVLTRPLAMLGALAPEWFGFRAEDAHRFQSAMPELTVTRESGRRFD